MTQPRASQRGAGKRKRYDSVPEMARDLSEDRAFADAVTKKIEERNIISHLMAMRALQGLSQQDIAAKMGCTQSRVSKLETGKDDDLRIGDFHAYAEALGLELFILMASKEAPPIAEQIKCHVAALRRLFADLSKLVGTDDAMVKGMLKLGIDTASAAAMALAGLVKDIARKIPRPKGGRSPIRVEMQSDDSACPSDASCEREDCGLPVPG